MTTTTNPSTAEPPREDEYAVPLTGRRRKRHLARLLEMRETFARVHTERFCHGLPDASDAFIQMANIEEEIALLYPDVHGQLFPDWVSKIPDVVHEPGQFNPRCGICRAHHTTRHLKPVA